MDLSKLLESIDDGFVAIIGFGVTGKALAEFFENRKIPYAIYDQKEVACQGTYYINEKITEELLSSEKVKVLFPSPGVSLKNPLIQAAQTNDIPIVGELEWAASLLKGEFIAVTGTNGKSTTVRLIDCFLRDAGNSCVAKGNIGSPLITAVSEPPLSYYVIEESSYQLELVGSLHHKIAICLNVTDDHLDRYDGLHDYARAKANIIKNSTSSDYFIYNADDPLVSEMAKSTQAKTLSFSLSKLQEEGAFADNEKIIIQMDGKKYEFLQRDLALKGLHNLENVMASLLAVLTLKNDEKSIAAYHGTLKSFVGLPHRMEKVLEKNGVTFYNDSKATNIDAVVMALASFEENVVLIAGGRDKDSNFSKLKGLVQGKVKHLILFGEAREKINEAIGNVVKTTLVDSLDEAVNKVFSDISDGDTVLLSPACASFDQYTNFEERGKHFKELVTNHV